MFCSNCGNQINDGATFCPHCGAATGRKKESDNFLSDIPDVALTLLGFFIPLAGLIIFLICQESSPNKAKAAGKGALIGFCVSCVVSVVYSIVVGGLLGGMIGGGWFGYDYDYYLLRF